MKISEKFSGRPAEERTPQENRIYDALDSLAIPFDRVDHDHADTMEDCLTIEKVLGAPICKNLLLTNRQETDFYLLLLPGQKVFKTKFLSSQLNCARLSFASPEHMASLLQTVPGSASALELLFDTEHRVRLVMDRELQAGPVISGHPGFSTSTLSMSLEDLLRYVRSTGHEPVWVDLPSET